MTDVIVVGAGPTGLMVACELARAGVSVELIDRIQGRSDASRSAGMHARTMEVLEQRGMLDAFLGLGRTVDVFHFAGLDLDMSRLPTRHPFMLGIMQTVTERELQRHAAALGVVVTWSTELVGFEQDDHGVTVTLCGPAGVTRRHSEYVVGCDGGRSAVRQLSDIGFPGSPGTMLTILGDVELADPPTERLFLERRPRGVFAVMPFGVASGTRWYRVIAAEYGTAGQSRPATFERLRDTLISLAGSDFGMHSPRWVSQYVDASRQAARYRCGRVFLAGDAAHIHSPNGGQGMNLGIQDAVNLGWKLAAVVRGDGPASLLDTYHAERHPVGARVLANTQAQTALLVMAARSS